MLPFYRGKFVIDNKVAKIIANFYDYNLGPTRGLQRYPMTNNIFAQFEYQEILFFHGGPAYYGARPDSVVARQWPFQDAFSFTDVREVTQDAAERYIDSLGRDEFRVIGATLRADPAVRNEDNKDFKFCEGDTNFWYRCAPRLKAKLTPRARVANLVPRGNVGRPGQDVGLFDLNPLPWLLGYTSDESV